MRPLGRAPFWQPLGVLAGLLHVPRERPHQGLLPVHPHPNTEPASPGPDVICLALTGTPRWQFSVGSRPPDTGSGRDLNDLLAGTPKQGDRCPRPPKSEQFLGHGTGLGKLHHGLSLLWATWLSLCWQQGPWAGPGSPTAAGPPARLCATSCVTAEAVPTRPSAVSQAPGGEQAGPAGGRPA